ncbi:hypothetical protein EIP86_001645 [Pleurotus ostreatoroseus]|nr:hypothetical protein EIP86_001645 [Pleurotus ostreatoroseus]
MFKTERDSFRVLDQNGQVRLVRSHQISMGRDSNRAIATDAEGHELRVNDNAKEIDGEVQQLFSKVGNDEFYTLVSPSSLSFYNREYAENSGVFVTHIEDNNTNSGGLEEEHDHDQEDSPVQRRKDKRRDEEEEEDEEEGEEK